MIKYEYKKLTPFKWFVLENFPFIEADFDALTDWQLFCKLGKEMNLLISKMNEAGLQVENLTTAFNNLENYVNNYFESTDFQGLVNNKINEMVKDGTLAEIINQDLLSEINSSIEKLLYISTKTIKTYNNIEELKNDTELKLDDKIKTLGFYNAFDKGGAYYIIKENLTSNNSNIIPLNNGLFAELILSSYMTTRQFGCAGNGIINDSINLQNTFDLLVENYPDGFKLEVVGNLLLNAGIKLKDDNNNAKNITIFGNNSTVSYGSANYQNNGFTFIANQYTKTEALLVHNIKALKIDSIFFTTTETVENGGLPLNRIIWYKIKKFSIL